jgi:hypothetical protein
MEEIIPREENNREEITPKEENKKIQVILISVLIIISSSAVIGYKISTDYLFQNNEPTGPFLATFYTSISAEDAYNLIIANETPLIIIDARSCKCDYNKGHLPNATWNVNPYNFWNKTEDLIVYSKTNEDSIFFLDKLVNKTYSRLFYINGGYKTWLNAGYPTEL